MAEYGVYVPQFFILFLVRLNSTSWSWKWFH